MKLMGSARRKQRGKRQAAGFIFLHREFLHPSGTDDFLRQRLRSSAHKFGSGLPRFIMVWI